VSNLGYEGVFIASFVGNFIPFLTVPYLIIVFSLAGILDPILLSLVSALGASIGKLNSYFIGRGAGKYVEKSRYKKKFEVLKKALGDYTFVAILIASATPLPDDYIFIPVGLMRYSFTKTFIATFIGKTVLTLIVASGGKITARLVGWESTSIIVSIVLAVIFIIVITLYMKLNIEEWIERRFLSKN